MANKRPNHIKEAGLDFLVLLPEPRTGNKAARRDLGDKLARQLPGKLEKGQLLDFCVLGRCGRVGR